MSRNSAGKLKRLGLFSISAALLWISTGCTNKSTQVDLTGIWRINLTVDLCGTDYIEKSKLEFVSDGDRIVSIKQTYLNGIDYSRGDPQSCEEQSLTDSFEIHPENLGKLISPTDLKRFLPEWDGLAAAHTYTIKEFSNNKLVVRAVRSARLGDIETRTYSR